LLVLVAGWLVPHAVTRAIGGGLAWLAILAFAYNIMRSVAAKPAGGGG
jgi:cbb3-type cytochrome oxidase subunit 1